MTPKQSGTQPSINTMESLQDHLKIAMQIEHYTIPPYLCALYSIKDGTNREARDVIQSVAMEEMLHLMLVANLLIAVGGRSALNCPEFVPQYPSSLPHFANPFMVNLRKFSKPAIDTFIEIETPESKNPPEFEGDRFGSIGQFYDAIEKALECLCSELGEKHVFGGSGKQVQSEYYYSGAGGLFEIHSLEDAKRAITEIKEQGEAAPCHVYENGPGPARSNDYNSKQPENDPIYLADTPGPHHVAFDSQIEPAHYYRFKEIREGRYYQRKDTPITGPNGPDFPVQWDCAWNMQDNPIAANYIEGSPIRVKMDAFNSSYSRLLDRLQAAFTGAPECLVEAVGDMFEIKHRGTELMRVPNDRKSMCVPNDCVDGTTVGPSFEYIPIKDRKS